MGRIDEYIETLWLQDDQRNRFAQNADVVTFEAQSPAALQQEFEAAVDDHLETCDQLDRPAQKPLKGQFNVRVPPKLHKAAVLRAMADSVSLNEVLVNAIAAYLCVASDASETVASPVRSSRVSK